SHPDEATEAMNRIAQAFITLVERHCPAPQPRRAQTELSGVAASPKRPAASRTLGDTAVVEKTRLDWQAVPPPVRPSKQTPLAAIPVGVPEPVAAERQPPAMPEHPTPVENEEEVIRSLAEDSPDAR